MSCEYPFKALAYGEGYVFSDVDTRMFCNILQVHDDKMSGTELLGLYIMNYLQKSRISGTNTLYGLKYEKASSVINNIANVFICLDNCERENLVHRLDNVMEHFYESSVVLRSIFEYEVPNNAATEKVYKNDYGIYLSLRGEKLFELLSHSSLLFEIYRDDIDTNIENNTICSEKLSRFDVISYLIQYINVLFLIEKEYISKAEGKFVHYVKMFGDSFLVSPLLAGVGKTISRFFSYDYGCEEYKSLKSMFIDIVKELNSYSEIHFNIHRVKIGISVDLERVHQALVMNKKI